MTDTLTLYQIADNNGIEVYSFPLSDNGSLCVMDGNEYYIGIDTELLQDTAQERVHLSHELGHCVTGAFYNRYSPYDIRARHEHTADRWAIKKLVPLHELKKAVRAGYREVWELAEYFAVTCEFMRKAFEYYRDNAHGGAQSPVS